LLSLVHVLEWRAAVNPDATALTDHQGAELTYAGLAAAMQRSAAGFAAAGVAPGERLAGFKCPTGVTVVSELPRNATGKVLRAALREPFWAGRDRLVS
jgi:acyl-CoA synthetase (AMP-forming)/AMP-acid ligase II